MLQTLSLSCSIDSSLSDQNSSTDLFILYCSFINPMPAELREQKICLFDSPLSKPVFCLNFRR